jgi:hypothetical protein
MSTPDPHGLAEVPEAVVRGHRRVRLPLVWIIPALAALIGGWIAVRAVLERGPTIRIRFQTADGLGDTNGKPKDFSVFRCRTEDGGEGALKTFRSSVVGEQTQATNRLDAAALKRCGGERSRKSRH